ncbi:hypothetical protein QCA50_019374 [Cerrena zonata]|uniref:Uncharacterized protein n=1 Tax=Cerrena zonata TaxID=2478898 RepID=A0AAW0FAT8_9APHY
MQKGMSNNYGLARHKFACRVANEFVIPLIARHVVEIIKNVTIYTVSESQKITEYLVELS